MCGARNPPVNFSNTIERRKQICFTNFVAAMEKETKNHLVRFRWTTEGSDSSNCDYSEYDIGHTTNTTTFSYLLFYIRRIFLVLYCIFIHDKWQPDSIRIHQIQIPMFIASYLEFGFKHTSWSVSSIWMIDASVSKWLGRKCCEHTFATVSLKRVTYRNTVKGAPCRVFHICFALCTRTECISFCRNFFFWTKSDLISFQSNT